MNPADFEAFRQSFAAKCEAEIQDRGPRYAPGDDRLANFKRNARGRRTKFDVWAVYAGKHWDAINSMIDRLSDGETVTAPPGEDVLSNFIGMRNYLELGAALVIEHLEEMEADRLFAEVSREGTAAILQEASKAAGFVYVPGEEPVE